MITKAVIEKITSDGIEVLLGDEEAEITIQKDKLQHISNYKVGDWLDVFFEEGKVKSVRLNQEETNKVKNRIQAKMDILRKRDRT
jgi:hypothetical protein